MVRILYSFFLFSFLLSSSLIAQTTEPEGQSLLDTLITQKLPKLALEIDLKSLFEDRREMNYRKAMASITFDNGEVWTDEIKLKTRGVYRAQTCDNPPLKLKFAKKRLKARKLNKNNEFKLVYPCKSGNNFQNYVLKEYLVYKLYSVLTEHGLRVQLVDLEIKDSLNNISTVVKMGFLIEHREELIHRLGAVMSDAKCMEPSMLSIYDYTLFQVFQYFIGNTDWLLPTCKNCEIISMPSGEMVPIAYDFDFSGIVRTSYAVPKIELGLYSITQRYFLGHKKKMENLEPVLDLFQEKKAALIATINDFEYLSKRERKRMVKYINSFYKIIDNPKSVKKEFIHPMSAEMRDKY